MAKLIIVENNTVASEGLYRSAFAARQAAAEALDVREGVDALWLDVAAEHYPFLAHDVSGPGADDYGR